jgi:hypothetical protein
MRRKYGKGMVPEDFDSMCDKLAKQIGTASRQWSSRVLQILTNHAPVIAECSKRQFTELRRVLASGRMRQVGETLDKVQCYGTGLMPKHLVGNEGITAETFLALKAKERKTLTDGEVLVKSRNDVLRVRSECLTPAQTSKVVRGHKCAGGAKLLAPHEQNQKRPKKPPKYYNPVSFNWDGDTMVVTCELNTATARVRFTQADIKRFQKKAAESKPEAPAA